MAVADPALGPAEAIRGVISPASSRRLQSPLTQSLHPSSSPLPAPPLKSSRQAGRRCWSWTHEGLWPSKRRTSFGPRCLGSHPGLADPKLPRLWTGDLLSSNTRKCRRSKVWGIIFKYSAHKRNLVNSGYYQPWFLSLVKMLCFHGVAEICGTLGRCFRKPGAPGQCVISLESLDPRLSNRIISNPELATNTSAFPPRIVPAVNLIRNFLYLHLSCQENDQQDRNWDRALSIMQKTPGVVSSV